MNFIQLLRELIKEEVVSLSTSDEPLGAYAFAPQRKGIPPEINTDYEDELYKYLMSYFLNNKKIPLKYVKSIYNILQSGKYSDVFHEPESGQEVYRGISVNEEKFFKMNLNYEKSSGFVVEKGDFLYTPLENSGISSWTTDERIALRFSRGDSVSIIFVAKVSDNPKKFVECVGGLYDVDGLDYHHEDEVLGIGVINVHKILWKINKIEKTKSFMGYDAFGNDVK